MSRYAHLTVDDIRLATAEAVGDERDILEVVKQKAVSKR